MIELRKIDWPPLIHGAQVPLWRRLRDFVLTLLAWALLFWALGRGRYLRATEPMKQPPPLTIAAQAADFGLSEATVAPWREARILVVHFGADGQPSHGDVRLADNRPPASGV